MKYMKKDYKDIKPYTTDDITEGIVLNANESPYLPPMEILEEFSRIKPNLNRYPDISNKKLCDALAKRYKCNNSNICCGVGSDELLDATFRAVLAKDDVVLAFSPTFSMYKVFSTLVGANYIDYTTDDFHFDYEIMISEIKKHNPKLVLICSPNNPTGEYIEEEPLRKIIESTDALIVLDLAYIDFAPKDYYYLALEYDNVIAFKTFSKALALPSIRVGYAISNKDNIDMIKAVKGPYSVNSISEEMAVIAINRYKAYERQINLIKEERERLYNELLALGFMTYKSEANFLFVIMDKKFYDALLDKKIYIRRFTDTNYRITVGTKKENNTLLEVLKNALL